MEDFTIYVHPQGDCEAVKIGWSWPAFFFAGIWPFVKKMWALGFGILVIVFVLVFIIMSYGDVIGVDVEQPLDALTMIGSLVLGIIVGTSGNKWREANLRTRGFQYKGTITADSRERALMIFIQRQRENTETGNTNM